MTLQACSTMGTRLEPINHTISSSIVMDALEGVEVAVILAEWDGAFQLSKRIFPVRVRVRNRGSSIVRVTFDQFSLADISGDEVKRLKAISPGKAQRKGRFYGRNFGYPAFVGVGYPWGWWGGVGWRGSYWGAWAPAWMPSMAVDLTASALPYGDVDPGSHVEGWLFFPRLPSSAKRLDFEVQLITDSGVPIGTVTIPFDVVKGARGAPA